MDNTQTNEESKMTYAVMQRVKGNTSNTSLLAWAGEPFKVYESILEAYKACKEYNAFMLSNGIKTNAFVSKGILTNIGWKEEYNVKL